MSIQNWWAYKANLWDWGFLDDCFFQTGIRVTDIDGCVERNGYLLLLETKAPGVPLKIGQKRLFEAFVRNGIGTVIVIWGKPGQPQQLLWWTQTEQETYCAPNPAEGITTLQGWVKHWFTWTDRQPPLRGLPPLRPSADDPYPFTEEDRV